MCTYCKYDSNTEYSAMKSLLPIAEHCDCYIYVLYNTKHTHYYQLPDVLYSNFFLQLYTTSLKIINLPIYQQPDTMASYALISTTLLALASAMALPQAGCKTPPFHR